MPQGFIRTDSNPEYVGKILVAPDFIPLEQRKNKALRQQLMEMNKVENNYRIKKQGDSVKEILNESPCTDNFGNCDYKLLDENDTTNQYI